MNLVITLPRTPDVTLVEKFKSILEKFGSSPVSVTIAGLPVANCNSFTEGYSPEVNAVLKHRSCLIEVLSIVYEGIRISYFRGGSDANNKSPVYDQIIIKGMEENTSFSAEKKIDLLATIHKNLKSFDPSRLALGAAENGQAQIAAIHESTLSKLEELNATLIEKTSQFREDLENRYQNLIEGNEKYLKDKQDELTSGFNEKLAEVERKEKELEARSSLIDDRDNTHARREIRDKMLDDVKAKIEAFRLSPSTSGKRRPVLIGIIFMALGFFAMIAYTIYETNLHNQEVNREFLLEGSVKSAPSPALNPLRVSAGVLDKPIVDNVGVYLLWLRLAICSIGFFGTILFYIKWANKWAEQHSAAELHLQQFYIDVNRANWVVESCLEWKKETNSDIPDTLLASITNQLFLNDQKKPDVVIHPADQLASALLGSASKLKLKVGNNELEYDKPGKINNSD